MKNLTQWLLSVGLTISLALAAPAAMAEVTADAFVKANADDVLAIIKKDKDIQNGDMKKIYDLAEDKILPNFDFERIGRLVLGKYWASATKQQQDDFTKEFRSLMIRTYSTALSKYRNQTIEYKPLRASPTDKDVTVKTLIVQPGGQPIAVDYALEKSGDSWKVFDIAIEGVSLVTNYRGQFSGEVRQSSLDSLIQKLSEKNKQAGLTK